MKKTTREILLTLGICLLLGNLFFTICLVFYVNDFKLELSRIEKEYKFEYFKIGWNAAIKYYGVNNGNP